MITIDETPKQKKLIIRKDTDSIVIKVKHIPIFSMMLHQHFNDFVKTERFGNHMVFRKLFANPQYGPEVKCHDTFVKKINKEDWNTKYAIANFDIGTRLYGLDETYLMVTEQETNELIKLLTDYYMTICDDSL